LLAGVREWPSQEKMIENADQEKEFKRALYPFSTNRGALILANFQHYHDLLLRDMQIDPMRYGGLFGMFRSFVLPVVPCDFEGALLDPNSRAKEVEKLTAPAPLIVGAGIALVVLGYYNLGKLI
jgi:hypothetical protein